MRRVVAALACAAALGCSEANHFPPPPPAPACAADCAGVGTHIAGPGTSSGAGGADAGTGQVVDVTGKVGLVVDAALTDVNSYGGAAIVFGPGDMGATVKAPYGGAAGASFTLRSVLAGSDWLYVEDATNGGGGVTSTFSPHVLPPAGELVVPVLDETVIQSIAQSQPGGFVPDASRAQVVLALRRAGAPLSGVSISGSAGAGLIAYDAGPGIYSSLGKATGSAGGIVIMNVQASSMGGALSLHLTDAAAHASTVQLPVAPGAATIATLDL